MYRRSTQVTKSTLARKETNVILAQLLSENVNKLAAPQAAKKNAAIYFAGLVKVECPRSLVAWGRGKIAREWRPCQIEISV